MARPVPAFLRPPVPCLRSETGCAAFSSSGRYRWLLGRSLGTIAPHGASDPVSYGLIFCGLNPSTADASRDDPTLRRLTAFARQWGYRRLIVVNLFALITPSPAALRRHRRPVGPANEAVLDHWLSKWSRRSHWDLWFGWGANGGCRDRDRWLLDRVEALRVQRQTTGGMGVFCLGRTRGGHPRHPLYLPASAKPQPWFAADQPRIRHPVAMVPASTVHP